jgi:hypothetical protein
LFWNNTDAKATSGADIWGTTSSTFSFRQSSLFDNGEAGIAYCFANTTGLLKVGSYAGSGSDVSVDVGFTPKFVMTKCHDVSGQEWVLKDSARGTDKLLIAEGSAAQSTARPCTFTTSGFTFGSGQGPTNWNGRNYYYIAIGSTSSTELDVLNDTPTNYESDGIVHGNFCTLNPLDGVNGQSNITLSQGNLKVTSANSSYKGYKSTIGITSGKFYWEYTSNCVGGASNLFSLVGIHDSSLMENNQYLGGNNHGWSFLNSNGTKAHGASQVSYGSADGFGVGDVVMMAFDADNGKIWWGLNGTWIASGNPATGANEAYSGITGDTYFPAVTFYHSGAEGTFNFGQRSFKYTLPTNYKALCTQNLPDTFSGDNVNNPSKYFNVLTWTGDGLTSRAIAGLGFQPDLSWIKRRNTSLDHFIWDAARGVTKELYTNQTYAEGTATNKLASFDSGGITVKDNSAVNADGDTYVGWFWDAGTAQAASGTYGSNSKTYSRWTNTTAGISIIKWDADGTSGASGLVVPHGLGTTPEFLIYKPHDTGSTSWFVMTTVIDGSWDQLKLNTSDDKDNAAYTGADNTYIQNQGYSNSENVMCYAFTAIPGFSAFGSITGNGSTDGPFVYTGFKPKFIIWKGSNVDSSWGLIDTARSPHNVADDLLTAEANSAEDGGNSNWARDILSNGFKIRGSHSAVNGSSNEFLYAAWAEHPFKTSRAN